MVDTTYRLPRGVAPIAADDGDVFVPEVGFLHEAVTEGRHTDLFRVACSADDVAAIFLALSDAILPERAFLILELHDEDIYLSDFMPRATLEERVRPHLDGLVEDGMLAFGLAFYDDDHLNEVFVDDHKCFTVFTTRPDSVRQVLLNLGVEERPTLTLLGTRPHAHLSDSNTVATVQRVLVEALGMQHQKKGG